MDSITLGQIMSFGGGAMTLIGLIVYFVKPISKLWDRIRKLEEHQDNDNKRLNKLDDDIKEVLLSVQVLLKHGIDNNHTGELKQREQDLNKYILNRK